MSGTELGRMPSTSSVNSERPAIGAPSRPPRVVVAGATGRLGGAFSRFALDQGWELHGAIVRPSSRALGRSLAELGIGASHVTTSSSERLEETLVGADMYVGAAPVEAERSLLPRVAAHGVPAVLAATGWTPDDVPWLEEIGRRIPFVLESNYSLGAEWLHRLLRDGPTLPAGFDVSVVEAHRIGKRDRPSGTSLALAAAAQDRIRGGRPTLEPVEAPTTVPIASIRGGELPGIHEIWIAGNHELLRVEHIVLDRTAFAWGMFQTAGALWQRLPNLAPGRYHPADLTVAGSP
ncbi:MAG: hypothetical protein L3K03_01500 [Thermoplasmata archaeon]|nr:hypothetical protein [Thermoplasmata archaeon]